MKRWPFFSIITLLICSLITLLLASRSDAKTVTVLPNNVGNSLLSQLTNDNETVANCRYGTTPADDDLGEKTAIVSRIGAGWYLTFNVLAPYPPPENGADFVHMIKVRQKKDGFDYLPGYDISPALNDDLANYILANPGDIWIFGNEVDRGPNPGETNPDVRGQGDTHAEVYAAAYHEAYNFIKDVDSTAQVAISGLVEVTPGRLQYLDKVWNTYLQEFGRPMPVDIWTMHLYILPEVQADGITPNGIANVALGTNPALGRRESGGNPANCSDPGVYCFAEHDDIDAFSEQIIAMRQWMADHGQKEKPLLLSEYSILYPYIIDGDTCFLQDELGQCFKPDRVYEFMNRTFHYLNNEAVDPNLGYSLDNNRLIQQYIWFTVYNKNLGSVSNLVEEDFVTLTALGQNFKNHVYAETPTQNLLIERVEDVIATISEGGTATAQLSTTFRNNGNTKIDQPFTITFYEDAALTKPINSTEITSDVFGCTSRPYKASVEWPGLTEGVYEYWVKIDSGNVINEQPGDLDNVGTGQVLITRKSLFLPVILGHK